MTNASETSSIIEMTNVAASSLRNASATIVENVNWRVLPGERWVVAGLHGAGKTDFLMMTAGLTAPQRGDYRLFGEPMPIFEEARLATRLRVGLVFDGGQLFHHLTVAENVGLPLRYHRDISMEEVGKDVEEILEWTELKPWAHSTPAALSRNWQKRVGLARAIALRPELLLVDNPLAGLDSRHARWWLRFLDEAANGGGWMQGQRVTWAATVDDLRPWQDAAQHFATIRDKQFSVIGSRAELSRSAEPLVKELLAGALANE